MTISIWDYTLLEITNAKQLTSSVVGIVTVSVLEDEVPLWVFNRRAEQESGFCG